MTTYRENLQALLAAEQGELSPARANQLSALAEEMTKAGVKANAPPPKSESKPNPLAAVDARIAELSAECGKGSDAQKNARAAEMTSLLAKKYRIGATDHNGWTLPYVGDDGDAA